MKRADPQSVLRNSRIERSAHENDPAGIAARRSAVAILQRVDTTAAFADVLLGQRLNDFSNQADRGLLTILVMGTLAWQGRLDYELRRRSTRPLDQLDPEIRALLRVGLYQLRILTRIPAHAAVDTAVHLARDLRGAGASGFVNAVLRGALREPVALPDRATDDLEYLATTFSHPRWLVERFIEWFEKAAAEALISANNEAAPSVIRLNLSRGNPAELIARLQEQGIDVTKYGLLPETALIRGPLDLSSPAFLDGLYTPQSEASQLVGHLLSPPSGATVLDCAAAPGGKSTHLAELVGPQGRVLAIDLKAAGLRRARAIAARLQHRNIDFVCADSARALPLRPGTFDAVLLDAPCSGLGTLREHPELRWRIQPGDLARMASLQSRMLERAAELIARGGVLVYSVCSLAPEEGEQVIDRFLARNSEFVRHPEGIRDGQLGRLISADGAMRTRPDVESRDGFYAIRLKKLS